jgi:formylglycine-generating enzyme required for sulfatase activity
VAALRAAAEARIALDTPAERAAALPLLDDALTLSGDRDQRLTLLRISAHVVSGLANVESGTEAHAHWTALLRAANEGLRLAGERDAGWLTTKLEALRGLGRYGEALEDARTMTARLMDANTPDAAAAARWLTRARLAWQAAGESPTDEVRQSLDAASRIAPGDPTIAAARQQLLAILKPGRFPPRLAQLGFVANKRNGAAFIVPPVCQIPAGEFLMGSDKRRYPQAYNSELPQHRLNLAAYSIARFPVTVAEYACFVETGQRQPQQWAQQMQNLEHPVTYISWDDAVAYAAWLAQQTGQPWRLPTEAEWEKAVRWDQRSGVAHLYPWGDAFDQSRANTSESGRGGTNAVGSYPNGASPYGAEEMAGNVWEWTHSLYKAYPYTGNDGREVEISPENRVLRGGSWNGVQQAARAAFRTDFGPDYLNNNIGFRLVLVAAGS